MKKRIILIKRPLFICIISFLIASLLATAIVHAEEDKINESKRNDFNARLSHINCKILLTEKQIDLLSKINENVSSLKSALNADYIKLQEFSAAFNNKEFNNYFTTTFKDNLKKAVMEINQAKKDFRKSNLTKEEKSILRDDHKKSISEYSDCINKADKDIADARAGYLNSWINKWNNVITKMKERGYDTSEMESVVSDARIKLLPALEAIKSATAGNRNKVMGTARNLHLYLWTRFEIARLNIYLKSIETDAIAEGYQTEFNAIKGKLTGVSALAVEGKIYGPGEFETIWKAIRDATMMLKELNRKIMGKAE